MDLPANLKEFTDEQLIELVRKNNQEWYAEIIHRYQAKLSHYLRKFVHNPDELQDVLQDVFIKAFRNLYGFDISKKFSPWIYRIAHNEAINYLKNHHQKTILLNEEDWQVIEDKKNLIDKINGIFTKELIEQALFSMNKKYQEPLILFFFEEKTYEEISDILKIPKSTVGVLILRGKKILKENLKKYVTI